MCRHPKPAVQATLQQLLLSNHGALHLPALPNLARPCCIPPPRANFPSLPPSWLAAGILIVGGAGIVLGLATYGYKVGAFIWCKLALSALLKQCGVAPQVLCVAPLVLPS